MAGNPVGIMFVELDLDATKYTKAQKEILAGAEKNSADINKVFKTVGTQSDEMYNAMRKNIQNALGAIKQSHLSTASEIERAQRTASEKLKQIDTQQFGAHESLLSKLKANWIAASAAIYAAWQVVSKAWSMLRAGAEIEEQKGILDNLAVKYQTTADEIVASMKIASEGMISNADLIKTALSGIAKGLDPKQLTDLADAAKILGDVVGKSATVALNELTESITKGQERGLKPYIGTMMDLDKAFGGLTSKMTSAEKTQALLSITVLAAAGLYGQQKKEVNDTADRLDRLTASYENTKNALNRYWMEAVVGAVELAKFQFFGQAGVMLAEREQAAYAKSAEGIAAKTKAMQEAAAPYQKQIDQLKAELALRETEAEVKKRLEETEKQRLKVIEDTTKSLGALSAVMQKYGEDALKMSKDNFGEQLKAERVTVEGMATAMTTYLTTIKEVYDARIAGEKAVAEAMEKAGAKPADQMKIQSEILKLEKEYLTTRLAGWQQYYDALAIQHGKATDTMKTKTAELAKLEGDLATMKSSAISVQASQYEKLWAAQGKANDDHILWDKKRAESEDLYRLAMSTTGEARIKYLNEYIKSQESMTGKEFEYSKQRDIWTGKEIELKKEVGSESEKVLTATRNISDAQKIMLAEQQSLVDKKKEEVSATDAWKLSLEAAMKAAKTQMDAYMGQIDALSRKISEMDKSIVLTANVDQAVGAANQIKAIWDSIQSKTITLTVNGGGGAGGGGGGGGYDESTYTGGGDYWGSQTPGGGPDAGYNPNYTGNIDGALGRVFDMGDVIPFADGGIFDSPIFFPTRSGLGLMGEAGPEAIMPLSRGADGKLGVKASGGGQVINLSINISGANKSGEQLADEIVRPLMRKMKQLGARVN